MALKSTDLRPQARKVKAPKQDWLDIVFPDPETSSISNAVTKKIRLKWSHIGHLIQQGNGPLQPDSVMEAALTLSRLLTESSIQHEFPGGSVVKLLLYKPPRGSNLNDKNYDQRQDDREILQPFFHERFSYDPVEWSRDVLGVHVTYIDQLHGENIRIEFPTLEPQSEDWQKKWIKQSRNHTDEAKTDPVSLFNYRLSCAINRDLQEAEIDDFESLCTTFEHHLHHHRKHIDVNTAKIAAGRYPAIQQVLSEVLSDVGLELGVVQEWKRPSAPPAGRNESYYPPVGEGKRQVSNEPVSEYDRYEHSIHAGNEELRGEEMAGPPGTSCGDFGEGVSDSGDAKKKTHPEEDLVKGLRNCFIGTMKSSCSSGVKE